MHLFTAAKRACGIGIACAALLTMSGTGVSQNSAKTDIVTVEGCPVPGVEGGCLVITGKDGRLYEISSAKPRPKVGDRAISLTGQKSTQASICMQGTRLDHIDWHYTDQKCPQAPAEK